MSHPGEFKCPVIRAAANDQAPDFVAKKLVESVTFEVGIDSRSDQLHGLDGRHGSKQSAADDVAAIGMSAEANGPAALQIFVDDTRDEFGALILVEHTGENAGKVFELFSVKAEVEVREGDGAIGPALGGAGKSEDAVDVKFDEHGVG